jgi:tyrosyl-tRNA synthetase
MGKTADGAVWLDAKRLAPYDYYQFWINCDDRDVEKLLKTFTFLPLDEIDRLARLEGAEIREAKQVLAFEATVITHGEAAAQAAAEAAKAAFSNGGSSDAMPTTAIPASQLSTGLGLLEALTQIGLTQSNGEARRLIKQGGVYVNDQRIDQAQVTLTLDDVTDGAIMLRMGKKKYHRLIVE